MKIKRNVLLVNPWIYDFSAYDFWQKPLGLLYIGAILNRLGYRITLLDCLDRYNPEWNEGQAAVLPPQKAGGAGKYHREELPKPAVLAGVPRKYCRYGASWERVDAWLRNQDVPDVILLTSHMTYWYPALCDMMLLLRALFPQTPILLGGIYATLCPEHAQKVVRPDYLFAGEGERQAVHFVSRICNGPGGDFEYHSLDDLPYPWLDGYAVLASVALLSSRGCPYRCTFCASDRLSSSYRRRTADAVFQEMVHWRDLRGVRNFAFYDDAFLYDPEEHAKPLLRKLAGAGLHLHTPNGLQPRRIDEEMADLLHAAGAQTLRLSYESSNRARQQGKVNNAELAAALKQLRDAGFTTDQIGVYILYGLPDQEMGEAKESIQQVHDLGARINLASYSPIPGTRDYLRCIANGEWRQHYDLLLTNNSLYPLWRNRYSPEELTGLEAAVKQLNQSLS